MISLITEQTFVAVNTSINWTSFELVPRYLARNIYRVTTCDRAPIYCEVEMEPKLILFHCLDPNQRPASGRGV